MLTSLESDEDNNTMVDINWCLVARGVLVSMSQVYAINHVEASILMNFAVLIASPLLFVMSTIGAVIGCLAGRLNLANEAHFE